MSVNVANVHQMMNLVKNEDVLIAIETILRNCVPVVDINDELSGDEIDMLLVARKGEYELLEQ